jgi:signal transduction histidine kinase
MGYAKMMLTVGAESLSDMQRQFLETINRNVERLDSNLSAVQDMTRIDRATVKLTPTSQSVADVAELVLDELQSLVEENENRVMLDFPDDLPPVHADADRLKQILHVLLDNAIRYTPPGGHIRLHGCTAGDLVQIDVTDNGLGIPAAEQERVFSKFHRGEDERIREHAGLGLNLYIARELTQLHGGDLWFDSTAGQGSTFSFTLPAAEEKGQGE